MPSVAHDNVPVYEEHTRLPLIIPVASECLLGRHAFPELLDFLPAVAVIRRIHLLAHFGVAQLHSFGLPEEGKSFCFGEI
jgi:hypothetical protein